MQFIQNRPNFLATARQWPQPLGCLAPEDGADSDLEPVDVSRHPGARMSGDQCCELVAGARGL